MVDPLFEAVFREAPHGMAVLTPEGLYVKVNARFERLTGYDAHALVGRSFEDITPPEDVPLSWDVRDLVARTGTGTAHKRLVRRDGGVVWVSMTCSMVRDEAGEPRFVVAQYEDLTARIDAAERLHESEARFRSAFEQAPFGMCLIGFDGCFVRVNRAGCQILGFADEVELVGRPANATMHPDDLPDSVKSAERVREGIVPAGESERRFLRPDGSLVFTRGRTTLVRDADARPVCFLSHFVDVTEEKRRAEDQARLEEQVRRAQRQEALGRLAGGIAHDFNNLLSVILSSASIARRRTAEPRVVEMIDGIQAAASRSAALTRQLLILGRQDLVAAELLDVGEVLGAFEHIVRRTLGEDVAVSIDREADVPPVEIPRAHLEQVLLNLTVNARDALPRGGCLRFEARRARPEDLARAGLPDGGWVALTCADDGVGMAPDVAALVFEPFYTTKPHGQGTGLGLTIVYNVVAKAGGHVDVESAPGRGTRFRVLLPASARPPEPDERTDDAPSGTGRGERVVVVEDEPALLRLVATLLGEFGYEVVPFGDPREALAWFRAGAPPVNLLLSDVVMPGLSGAELVSALAPIQPAMRVVLMSGHTADRLAGHDLTNVAFLQKPFQAMELLGTVRRALS
ncbi:MAG: PAS domain S-box protein [Myxococcota bacterium]